MNPIQSTWIPMEWGNQYDEKYFNSGGFFQHMKRRCSHMNSNWTKTASFHLSICYKGWEEEYRGGAFCALNNPNSWALTGLILDPIRISIYSSICPCVTSDNYPGNCFWCWTTAPVKTVNSKSLIWESFHKLGPAHVNGLWKGHHGALIMISFIFRLE